MEDGELIPKEPNRSETPCQPPEDLYTTAQINNFLELPKEKKECFTLLLFPWKGKIC